MALGPAFACPLAFKGLEHFCQFTGRQDRPFREKAPNDLREGLTFIALLSFQKLIGINLNGNGLGRHTHIIDDPCMASTRMTARCPSSVTAEAFAELLGCRHSGHSAGSRERSLLNAHPSLPRVQLDRPAAPAPATDRGNGDLCRKVCPPLHSHETKGPAHRLQQTKQRHR